MNIPITTKVMKHCHSKSYKGKKQEVSKKADGSGGPILQTKTLTKAEKGKKLGYFKGETYISQKAKECFDKGGKFKNGTCFMGAPPENDSSTKSIAKKKDKCYHKAKAKYSKFPSAYASGYIAKCRKRGGNIK